MSQLIFHTIILFIFQSSIFTSTDCSPTTIKKLEDKRLMGYFFDRLDSVKRIQYPGNDQDTGNSVDLNPRLLSQFISDINTETFSKTGTFQKHYFFDMAPASYKDSEKCKDVISIQFIPSSCSFRIEIQNAYPVKNDCAGGSQVSYHFKIQNNSIVNFSRNEAG